MQSPVDMKVALEETYVFHLSGAVSAATNIAESIRVQRRCHVRKVYVDVKTAPTNASMIIDVNDDGSTISTTKTTISATETSGSNETFTSPTIDAGSLLTVDADQVGSSEAGRDLTVCVVVERTG